MPWSGFLAVGGGAAVGAWLRWGLGIMLVRREYLWGSIAIATLVIGSLAMTVAGILLIRGVYNWGGAA